MKSIGAVVIASLVLALAADTRADGQGVEITPFGAVRFGGAFEVDDSEASYELDDSASFGLIVNFPHRDNTQWEVFYAQQQSEAELDRANGTAPVVDVDLHTLQLGGTYLGEGETVQPYLAATIGGTHIRTSANGSKSDTFWSGSIGAGFRLRPNERLGFRLEVRAHGALLDSDTDLFCQTGPDLNVCAVHIDGEILSQIETFAGFVFRF